MSDITNIKDWPKNCLIENVNDDNNDNLCTVKGQSKEDGGGMKEGSGGSDAKDGRGGEEAQDGEGQAQDGGGDGGSHKETSKSL